MPEEVMLLLRAERTRQGLILADMLARTVVRLDELVDDVQYRVGSPMFSNAVIVETLTLKRFKVRLMDNSILFAVISPRMKHEKFNEGDSVTVELSPYEKQMCRIVNPHQNGEAGEDG